MGAVGYSGGNPAGLQITNYRQVRNPKSQISIRKGCFDKSKKRIHFGTNALSTFFEDGGLRSVGRTARAGTRRRAVGISHSAVGCAAIGG